MFKRLAGKVSVILLSVALVLIFVTPALAATSVFKSMTGGGNFMDQGSDKVTFHLKATKTDNGLDVNMQVKDPLYIDGQGITFKVKAAADFYSVDTFGDSTTILFKAPATVSIGANEPFDADVWVTATDGDPDTISILYFSAEDFGNWPSSELAGGNIVAHFTKSKN